MKKILFVLFLLLFTANVCNAEVYENIENNFQMDIGDNWKLTHKESQEGGMVLVFTAQDDKKSMIRMGISPVIDEKEDATLRDLPRQALNEYYEAYTGMIKKASKQYNITFADCKEIGSHYVLVVNGSLPASSYKNNSQLPFMKSNNFFMLNKKIYILLMDSWDTTETHIKQLQSMIGSVKSI